MALWLKNALDAYNNSVRFVCSTIACLNSKEQTHVSLRNSQLVALTIFPIFFLYLIGTFKTWYSLVFLFLEDESYAD